jgi:hypothetical protein
MSLQSICIRSRQCLLAVALLVLGTAAFAQMAEVERALMPGAVIEGHAKYEQECEKCHKRFDKAAQTGLCADCHKDVNADILKKTRIHGHLEDNTCRACHPDHKGRKAKIAVVDKEKFDHERTNFPLKGAHKEKRKKCEGCHVEKKKYREAPSDCFTCHRKEDVHKGGLGKKCEDCHNDVKWTETRFDHAKASRFKLDGEHAASECKECHAEGKYKDTPRDCLSCHRKDDNTGGHHGRFGNKCEKCHSPSSWEESTFDHGQDTKYKLKGKHQKAQCASCHKVTLYTEKTATKCVACHRKEDDDKGHKGSLGEKCETCHNEQDWKTTAFDHDKDTDYPLVGKHQKAKCESCHKSGLKPAPGATRIEKLPTKCAECHRKDDKEKGHKGKFGEKCDTCHTPKEWKKGIFDHDLDTRYALKGKHRETKCVDCHKGQLYVEKLKTECIACHKRIDDEKGHKGQLGSRCDVCHQETNWKVEKFDHNRSRFPLTGSHARAECKKCHETVAFRNAPRDCNGCHEKEDVHKGRFGIKCEVCHYTGTWKSWDFDHDKTKFRLEGGHKKVDCYGCHKDPVKGRATISRACISCHIKDDVHDGGFGSQCEVCHGADTWKRIRR